MMRNDLLVPVSSAQRKQGIQAGQDANLLLWGDSNKYKVTEPLTKSRKWAKLSQPWHICSLMWIWIVSSCHTYLPLYKNIVTVRTGKLEMWPFTAVRLHISATCCTYINPPRIWFISTCTAEIFHTVLFKKKFFGTFSAQIWHLMSVLRPVSFSLLTYKIWWWL